VSTFVLVHGAWHGAWCWSRLLPELEARGHRSVVMDLPVEDGDATFEEYADVVLVGHALGAMVLPLVAASPSTPTATRRMRPGPSSGCGLRTRAASGIVPTL
jgi:hypothetical protein